MLPIKICGLTNLEDVLFCIKEGASALGFIFADSPRRVGPGQVYEIRRRLPLFVTTVGVFVDQDLTEIKEIMKDCRLDLAQLHGNETPDIAAGLAGRVIKCFKAGRDRPAPVWRELPLRAVLVDTYTPERAGGAGTTFDWNLFQDYRSLGFPLILAGGLNPDNLVMALDILHPDAIDVSSGVEKEPGKKDPRKISAVTKISQNYKYNNPDFLKGVK